MKAQQPRVCYARHGLAASLCAAVFTVGYVGGEELPLLDVAVTVDFRRDVGQNRGSLFEAYDDQGQVVAGAGFLGAYNTQPRSNRRRLHFFLKPAQIDYSEKRLPRVNSQTGVYLADQQGMLFAHSRNGRDTGNYALDERTGAWRREESITGYDMDVAGKMLRVRDRTVVYDDRTILVVADETRICENYYANGALVLRLQDVKESSHSNRLIAIAWTTDDETAAFDPSTNPVQPLRSHGEFAYAMGQLGEEVLVATNTGGVYALRNDAWRVIVEPGPHSYQIYSMLNYYDRLLLGHYPSGELFEYDGRELRPLTGWPPVMPGVSSRAREAQTLAIYGGDLYAGVWPWAELWRYDRNAPRWQFSRRMFTHPEPTSETTHPYERETAAENSVSNLWGQRVTSVVPFGDSLYVSTSSKTGAASLPTFLAEHQWQEYGRVYQLRLPGQLSAEIDWTEHPTTLRCLLTADRMSLWQDGVIKAEQSLPARELLRSIPDRISWGRGVYGRLRGDLLSRHSNLDRAFLGAYVHLDQVFDRADAVKERESAIDEMLDRFQSSGLRVVMPYVTTTSGSAAYPSRVIPVRLYDDWDPLAHLIAGARKRELQVFPVVCVLACGHAEPRGILRTHPEWALRTLDGEPTGHISPANAEARDWVTSMIDEVVQQYDVDGILLDYLRYSNRPTRLDAASEAEFERYREEHATQTAAESLQLYREAGLTSLVRQISDSARAIRPHLRIAIYSWGPHVATNHLVAQAWPVWSQAGLVDMVNISGYCYADNYGAKYLDVFSRRIGDSVRLNRHHHGRADITFCLGVVTSHGRIQAASQVNEYLVRAVKDVSGVAIFTWSTLGPLLDEVNQSQYIPAFAARIGSIR